MARKKIQTENGKERTEKANSQDILIEQKPKEELFMKYIKRINKPPQYNHPQDMLDMVNQYLTDGCNIKTTVHGRAPHSFIVQTRKLSLYGLALHLGFTSRKQMMNFRLNNTHYQEVIDYGRTSIAQYYEELGQDGVSPTFMNFMLHNIDGLVMRKDDEEGGYIKRKSRIKFTNHDKKGNVRKLDGTND